MENFLIESLWLHAGLGLVLGLILGSFTTMLSYRLPRKLSIVAPPSSCPSCGTRLGIRDLVPIFSWLFGKGQCRHCGTKIGSRYLWIELAVTLGSIMLFTAFGLSLLTLVGLGLLIAIITAAVIRLERKS